jgi:hypothetical protein
LYEPELESLFNRLSRGQTTWVKSRRVGRNLNPFDKELQNALRGSNKKVVLEQPPVEYAFISENDVIDLAKAKRLKEAASLYKRQLSSFSQNLVKRDDALVEMLEHVSKESKRLLILRGADHELYLRSLLDRESITAKSIAYEEAPLLRRLISSLTMGKQVNEIDVQRIIHAMVHRQKGDYPEFLSLQAKAESMTEKELLASLTKQ